MAPPTRPETFCFSDDGKVPNSPLPLIVPRGALTPGRDDPAQSFERMFARNGWTNSWRDGIFDYHHYHSTAHEVLGIAFGSVEVRFGGESGATLRLEPGDVVVIPAGVGHARIGQSDDLLVVGAYAGGRDWDIVRDSDPGAIGPARRRIAEVPLPAADPVDGESGPLMKLWGG